MRLEPIDKPKGFTMRIAFWATRREFGKVMTTMKVLFPRAPKMVKLFYEIQKYETAGARLEKELHFFLAGLVSRLNGWGCCVHIPHSLGTRAHMGRDKIDAVSEYASSPLFSERERAALAFVEEATRRRHVSETTFKRLRSHFAEWGSSRLPG